jgi:hypothetical protein
MIRGLRWGAEMRGQAGFFDVDERLKQLSATGDSLEQLNAVVDFELFRADLERTAPRSEIPVRATPGSGCGISRVAEPSCYPFCPSN